MTDALVIGAGPAGLMAADRLASAGVSVTVAEAMPSVGRKFLMAGKSGLNLTKAEPFETFLNAYQEAAPNLRPMLRAFGPDDVLDWVLGLGQEVFTGSSGRVFPKAMKASPLLRAWLARLTGMGVQVKTRWKWVGFDNDDWVFDAPERREIVRPNITVLAMGGASWRRLGSTGDWAQLLPFDLAPFQPANAGLVVDWTPHMNKVFGQPLKNIVLRAGDQSVRAEAVISARGLEGGGIYAISRAVREGGRLEIDLLPDLVADDVADRIAKPRGKTSFSNHLRKVLKLDAAKMALLMEFAAPLSKFPEVLAQMIKGLPIAHSGLRPLDEAISTAGGIPFSALDENLMLHRMPGVFCAGEMLDWEAPTGGYLLTACLATGRWAGDAAARSLAQ